MRGWWDGSVAFSNQLWCPERGVSGPAAMTIY
jgi:hypothetical protein